MAQATAPGRTFRDLVSLVRVVTVDLVFRVVPECGGQELFHVDGPANADITGMAVPTGISARYPNRVGISWRNGQEDRI